MDQVLSKGETALELTPKQPEPAVQSYFDALREAMTWLSVQPGVVFLGQSVAFPGTAMHDTLEGIPQGQRIEMPVAEELQMGMSLGLALQGYVPVSIFPRFNFLLGGLNQLVNHLDRLPAYSGYRPRVIVRTAVGASEPLDPGHQHKDDFTAALRLMLKTVQVVRLDEADQIVPAYREAYFSERSTVLVERGNLARKQPC